MVDQSFSTFLLDGFAQSALLATVGLSWQFPNLRAQAQMCKQKYQTNGKVRETSYLSEDWYTRMVLCKDVNETEIMEQHAKDCLHNLLARNLFTDLSSVQSRLKFSKYRQLPKASHVNFIRNSVPISFFQHAWFRGSLYLLAFHSVQNVYCLFSEQSVFSVLLFVSR